MTHCELGWELFILGSLVLGGLSRAVLSFPEPSCFFSVFVVRVLSSLHCTVCHSSLRVLLLPPLLACGFVFRSCRGLPPHIKLHSPLGGRVDLLVWVALFVLVVVAAPPSCSCFVGCSCCLLFSCLLLLFPLGIWFLCLFDPTGSCLGCMKF